MEGARCISFIKSTESLSNSKSGSIDVAANASLYAAPCSSGFASFQIADHYAQYFERTHSYLVEALSGRT